MFVVSQKQDPGILEVLIIIGTAWWLRCLITTIGILPLFILLKCFPINLLISEWVGLGQGQDQGQGPDPRFLSMVQFLDNFGFKIFGNIVLIFFICFNVVLN